MCFKDGKVEKSDNYGFILSDSKVEKMYPLYYHNVYIFNSVKAWIVEGEWNESKLEDDIVYLLKVKKKPEPEYIVRNSPLILLDESIIEDGLPKVLKAAYAGKLTIDEYIMLIQNIAHARKLLYILPVEIDMNGIESGVSICLHSMEESDEPDSLVRKMISTEEIKQLTDDERRIYNKICKYRDNNIKMFAINRRMYLTALSKQDMAGMYQCEIKRFNLFDEEMAQAVATFFKRLSNADRVTFNHLFKKMWENRSSSEDLQKTESISGLKN